MSTLAVSFTISRKGDYNDRWNALMTAIRRIANGPTWDETTSFVLLQSPSSASQVMNFLPLNVGLGDKLLVMDMTNRTIAHKGMEYPATLASFFPPATLGALLGTNALRR